MQQTLLRDRPATGLSLIGDDHLFTRPRYRGQIFRHAVACPAKRNSSTRSVARASGSKPAILLNACRTQTSKAISLEGVYPGEELFFRELVNLAGLLDGDHTRLHCDDDRGLTTYYPSAGVRRWQTFSEQDLDQSITERRFHDSQSNGIALFGSG